MRIEALIGAVATPHVPDGPAPSATLLAGGGLGVVVGAPASEGRPPHEEFA